mgnify:CR=1 FL=1
MKKVITYGTYDLLHEGHINLLRRAKELGDFLIVGVTNDSFDRERGKLNVRNNVLERVEAVKATGLADMVIIEDYIGQKIDDILNDSTSFHHKADNLYEELVKNLDYSKYIMAAKIAKGMAGKIPFKQLPFLQKRNVFVMIRESISAYILNELTEKEENK